MPRAPARLQELLQLNVLKGARDVLRHSHPIGRVSINLPELCKQPHRVRPWAKGGGPALRPGPAARPGGGGQESGGSCRQGHDGGAVRTAAGAHAQCACKNTALQQAFYAHTGALLCCRTDLFPHP
jgi:hypothetical protein